MVFAVLAILHLKRRLSEKYCEIIKKPQGFSSKVQTLMHMTIFTFLQKRQGFSLKVPTSGNLIIFLQGWGWFEVDNFMF